MQQIAQVMAAMPPPERDEGKVISFPVQVQCQTCDDMGFVGRKVPKDHPDFGKAFPCPNPDCPTARANRERKMKNLLKSAGVKGAYLKFSFQTWDALPESLQRGKMTARLAMQMYVERRGTPFALNELYHLLPAGPARERCKALYAHEFEAKSGIVLTGLNGTGKTGLIACAAMELITRTYPTMFINALEMLGELFDGYGPKGDAQQILESIKSIDHLFLDEMTFEAKDSHRRALQLITRYRHDQDMPMVMTTNYSVQDFESWFGAQITSGILGKCHWIQMGGDPIRHELGEAQNQVW